MLYYVLSKDEGISTPSTSDVTSPGSRVIANVTGEDELLLEQAGPLIPCDWCP